MNPIDICKCLKLVESLMMPAATRKGIDLKFNLPEVMQPSLIGDRDRIQQVVLNLVSNAIKFTERGGVKVTLHCDVNQNENMADLEFCIEDTGIGIHPDALKRLFQPFVQADTSTTRKFGGTGLGLSIVKSLVGLMSGGVFYESNPGGGSKFCVHITLPVSNTTPLSPKEEKTPVFLEHLKVLIAEDNTINQKIAKMALNRISIKNVDVVENGQLAVDRFFAQGDYDVVLMDIQMPVLDGKKATKLIRSKEVELGRKRTPIIALTASALKTDQEECLEAGMDTHIAKPYSHEQLKQKISSIIN
jgi:CheY-like chemotaxis protein